MNQELYQALLQAAHSPVADGLSAAEALQAEGLFAAILHSTLDVIYQTPVLQKDVIARRTGEKMIRLAASIAAKGRLNYLKKEKLDQNVRRLDARGFQAARQLLIDPSRREELIPQARSILAEAEQLQEEISRAWPGEKKKYGHSFSELILDCQYVLDPIDKTSLRLGKLMKAKKRPLKISP